VRDSLTQDTGAQKAVDFKHLVANQTVVVAGSVETTTLLTLSARAPWMWFLDRGSLGSTDDAARQNLVFALVGTKGRNCRLASLDDNLEGREFWLGILLAPVALADFRLTKSKNKNTRTLKHLVFCYQKTHVLGILAFVSLVIVVTIHLDLLGRRGCGRRIVRWSTFSLHDFSRFCVRSINK
jgi:hypothetical protein